MTTRQNERATPADPRWLAIARGELGVRERPGAEHNPRILQYFAATKLRPSDDETPWCAAFVNWCLRSAKVPGTGKANARSFLAWGRDLAIPRLGCIVVLRRGTNEAQGHVGFYLGRGGQGDATLRVLGGNQGNAVTTRLYRGADVITYRWPEGVP